MYRNCSMNQISLWSAYNQKWKTYQITLTLGVPKTSSSEDIAYLNSNKPKSSKVFYIAEEAKHFCSIINYQHSGILSLLHFLLNELARNTLRALRETALLNSLLHAWKWSHQFLIKFDIDPLFLYESSKARLLKLQT